MKPFEKLKSVLITGLLIVLPAWLAVLLFLQILLKLGVIVKPIAETLPEGAEHPRIVALLVFVLVCVAVGLLVHTAIGKIIGKFMEENLLKRIPGYGSLRAIADQAQGLESERGFQPALIDVEDGSLSPAFLVETHDDGRCTVFVPSVPTPMAGAILIMTADRVHPVDVPVTMMMQCISKWGAGSGELLAALDPKKAAGKGSVDPN